MNSTSAAAVHLRILRIAGILLFAAWVWYYIRTREPLLHGSLLVFHEAGHILFMPFGEFMMVLGGSLFQLMVPAFFIACFLRRGDHFAACFAALYLAASMADVGTYIADARAGRLPLITGDRTTHDWTFLLIELERLHQDTAIGGFVRRLGVLVFWAALAAGSWSGWRREPARAPAPSQAGD